MTEEQQWEKQPGEEKIEIESPVVNLGKPMKLGSVTMPFDQWILTFEEGGRLFATRQIVRFELQIHTTQGIGPGRGSDKASVRILDVHQRVFPLTGAIELTEAQVLLERIFEALQSGKSISMNALLADRRAEILARNQRES